MVSDARAATGPPPFGNEAPKASQVERTRARPTTSMALPTAVGAPAAAPRR